LEIVGGQKMFLDLSWITIPVTIFTMIFFSMWVFLSAVHVIKKDSPVKPFKFNPHEPKVSIILPCRNEEVVIASAIDECLKQTYGNKEIIVVAHNCTDRTLEIARQFEGENIKVLELKTKEAGKGLGLSYGLKFATGDVVTYFDTDSLIDKNYLKNIVDFMYSGRYDVVQGRIVGSNPDYNRLCFLQHMENKIFLSMFWGGKQKLGLASGLGGTGVAIRRSALEKLNGFRNVLVEDFDLCIRAQLKNMKVGYCREAVVRDEKVPSYSMMLRQRSRWIAGHFEIIRTSRPAELWSLFRKNPVDFMQLMTPFYTLALWVSVGVSVASLIINQFRLIPWLWLGFFYTPLEFFVVQTVLLQLLFVLVIRKEAESKEEFRKCVMNLPLFYAYTTHWFFVFWKALFVKSWANTKTEHGFRGRES
jgi:cellulose synthase/poly-beta-1,6-N-acetylglucosamine synthase-like glycosyltransferase